MGKNTIITLGVRKIFGKMKNGGKCLPAVLGDKPSIRTLEAENMST